MKLDNQLGNSSAVPIHNLLYNTRRHDRGSYNYPVLFSSLRESYL